MFIYIYIYLRLYIYDIFISSISLLSQYDLLIYIVRSTVSSKPSRPSRRNSSPVCTLKVLLFPFLRLLLPMTAYDGTSLYIPRPPSQVQKIPAPLESGYSGPSTSTLHASSPLPHQQPPPNNQHAAIPIRPSLLLWLGRLLHSLLLAYCH